MLTMQGPMASAVAFALSGGEPVDSRRRMFADVVPAGGRDHQRRLIAAVEPLELSARGMDVATTALDAIRHQFTVGTEDAVSLALGRAMAAANTAVEADNRAWPAEERDRRVMVGVTAAVVEGSFITIAQLPPAQAFLIQDGRCYPLPTLASWRPDYAPEGDETVAEPLGTGLGVAPLLFRSSISPGDLILLCDSALARCLASATSTLEAGGRAPVQTLDEALVWLESTAVHNNLDDVQAACIVVPAANRPLSPEARRGRRTRQSRWLRMANGRQRGAVSDITARPSSAAREGRSHGEPDLALIADPTEEPDSRPKEVDEPFVASPNDPAGVSEAAADQPADLDHDIVDEPILVMEPVEQDLAAMPQEASGDDQRHGERPDVANVSEASVIIHGQLQARRQRRSRTGPLGRAVATLLALVVVCGASGLMHGRFVARAEHDEQVTEALATVDTHLAAAAQDDATEDALAEAAAAMDRAERLGIPASELSGRRAMLLTYRDQVRGVVRLGGVARVGGVPASLSAASDVTPRLVRANRDLYLVSGGFYRVDLDDSSLVAVLTPGSEVGEQVVGSLTNGAWSPGGIVVTDGEAIFTFDGSEAWSSQPLGLGAPERLAKAPFATLNGAFYVLDEETGQILKFGGEDGSASGQPWTDGPDVTALRQARDMVIDGDIHVLLADGRLATLTEGNIAALRSFDVTPSLTKPLALAGGMDTSALWVLDHVENEVRLLRIDPETGDARPFVLAIPEGAEAELATIHDVAVDEVGHAAYFLTENSLWRSDLPVFVPVE
ncbi:MAG TPA: hypothetical protein VGR16_15290 [Thermomicrobiales bacterium]|nr:hypothetical protein [Thermomicrobiales bacterium]